MFNFGSILSSRLSLSLLLCLCYQLQETCNERISETVKIGLSKETSGMEEATVSVDLLQATESVPLKQESVVEELHPEDSVEPLDIEPTTEEARPTEEAYDDILPKENITVETGECAAELTVQQPTSPEVVEAESSIVLPKEEEKTELLQPSVTEETHPSEDSVEHLSDPITEETHPTEAKYDDVLPKESISVDTVKTEECAAELSIQQPSSSEVAETESSIVLPKEEEKIELLQPSVTEETCPEDSLEHLSEPTTEEAHPTGAAYDEILPKDSIAVETVQTEECAAELTIQQPTPPEVAEAESSIVLPKEEEEAVAIELESAKPEVAAYLDVVQPTKVEERLAVPSADVQKPADAEQVEIKLPRPEVEEDVSLTLAKQPKSEDVSAEERIKIPSPKPEVEESVSLERMEPEPELEESLTLATPKSSAGDDESVSLSLQQPQEDEETDLTLSLKKPEDGMMPTRQRWHACRACSMDQS